jgi:phosphopantetheinyl transferase
MPLITQLNLDAETKLGCWHLTESEEWFSRFVSVQRHITHPHKRLQHLGGRFLLKYLFPDFPSELIAQAPTKKPFLPGDSFHFSISHAGDYAAALVSKRNRVGVDIELFQPKITTILHKFIASEERAAFDSFVHQIQKIFSDHPSFFQKGVGATHPVPFPGIASVEEEKKQPTSTATYEQISAAVFWSTKEALFKWYGLGQVDFRLHLRVTQLRCYWDAQIAQPRVEVEALFLKEGSFPLTLSGLLWSNRVMMAVSTFS